MEVDNDRVVIGDLPDEVMRKIFIYLSPKGVKIAALVNKRWNEIVGHSPEIMKRFTLNLEESENIIKRAINLKRKFQNAKIKNLTEPVKNILAIQNLKSLKITWCQLDISMLSSCIKGLKMLENFHAVGVNIHDRDKDLDVEKVIMKKLTSLKLLFSDPILLEIFDVNSLKKLKISSYSEIDCTQKIIEFLSNQPNLKELSIGGLLCDNFFGTPEILDFPFELIDLVIEPMHAKSVKELDFLKVHSETIERLVLQYPVDNAVYKFAIQNLPKLREFRASSEALTVQILSDFSPNQSVKKLTLLGTFKTLAVAKKVMDLFPSIESLDLSQLPFINWFHEFIIYIAQTKQQLKSLNVSYVLNKKVNFHFPQLRELTITKIHYDSFFDEFIQSHAGTLEKVCIQFVEDKVFVKSLTVNNIMSLKSLTHLIIGSETPLVIRMFNNKVRRPQAWSLEARIRSKNVKDYVALKFHFPDDIAIWEERTRVYDDELVRELSTVQNYGTNAFVNKYK